MSRPVLPMEKLLSSSRGAGAGATEAHEATHAAAEPAAPGRRAGEASRGCGTSISRL